MATNSPLRARLKRSLPIKLQKSELELSDSKSIETIPRANELASIGAGSIRIKQDFTQNPYLPKEVYSKLPSLLCESISVLQSNREKDIFIISVLGVLSGCMSNVSGIYDKRIVHANLYAFIIAPPANSKGTVVFAKEIGMKYHKMLVEESKQKALLLKSKSSKSGSKKVNTFFVEPPTKVLYIHANNSSAGVIAQLNEINGSAVMFETEADTLGDTLKQDWAGFSDLLRKGFHHEAISLNRKTNSEYVEVVCPQLSIVLTGTPGQINGLIKSAEDGLLSRFLFYIFESEVEWHSVAPREGDINYTDFFSKKGDIVLEMIDFLKARGEVNFYLTKDQWNQLDAFGSKSLADMVAVAGNDIAGTPKRLGLILFRICMVFSALKHFENKSESNIITCSDEDFNVAIEIVEVLKQHAMSVFQSFPPKLNYNQSQASKILEYLPESFTSAQAINIGETHLFVKGRMVSNYLKELTNDGSISKKKGGLYSKLN